MPSSSYSPVPRSEFLLDPDLVFLNHGSFGAVPRVVQEEYERLQRAMERNPVEWLARRADGMLAEARAALAAFLGAQRDDLVFFPNPTTALNVVTHSLRLQPGDRVVTTDHEYGAMDRTWRKKCREADAELVRVPIPLPMTTEDDFVERVWAQVDGRTKVLFLSHLTSATALVFPVAELCRRAREAGILSVIDGAHVPGHLPLDLGSLGCDVYSGALHKWLCAPRGASFLWATPAVQAWLQPLVVSWGWESDHPSGSTFVDVHEWQGTRDLSAFLTVPAAIEWHGAHDPVGGLTFARQLAKDTRRRLDALTGLAPICPDEGEWVSRLVAARLPDDIDTVAWQTALREHFAVEVPVHRWSDQPVVRVSIAPYTTQADTDALVDALAKLLAEHRR